VRDVEVAGHAARAAAAALLDLRRRGLSGRALGDAGDAAAQEAITAVLAEHRPDDVVFSEEAADDRSRLGAGRVWIVDPLDGTREYGEPDRSDFAVHVALWSSGGLRAAAVALPAVGEVLVTDPAPALPPAVARAPRIAVSRTRPPVQAAAAAAAVGGELVPLGSAGWKTAAVVRGEVDAYLHAGGMYQWDSAAPVAVALAAGLTALRLDGSPLRYNEPDPSLPDLLVCRPELAAGLLAAVR
jgi:3'(2'), 5'-bisphosphate nucleotidase